MKTLLTCTAMLAAQAACAGEDNWYKIQMACDAAALTVHLGDLSLVSPEPASRITELSFPRIPRSKETNSWGERYRMPSKATVKRTCGAFTIVTRSKFLNENIDGELGAIEFGTVEVRRGDQTVLPETALEECSPSVERYRFFGDCPDRWARTITIRQEEGAKSLLLRVVRDYRNDEGTLQQRVDETREP